MTGDGNGVRRLMYAQPGSLLRVVYVLPFCKNALKALCGNGFGDHVIALYSYRGVAAIASGHRGVYSVWVARAASLLSEVPAVLLWVRGIAAALLSGVPTVSP